MKPNVELFAEKVFDYNFDNSDKHLANTSDRTVWYRVNYATRTMFVPGMNVLRVNPLELDKYLAAVESFLKFDLADPRFKWTDDSLHLSEYSGGDVALGIYELKQFMDNHPGQLIACDTETRYLKWDDNKLLSIGFALTDDTCVALYDIPKVAYEDLQKLLLRNDIRYAWHNGKFDKNFLWYTCGIRVRVDEDSMLKHFAQVSEKKGTHGLKYLGPLYLQAPQWDDELDSIRKRYCKEHKMKFADFTYDLIPTSVLIPYMQRDCLATRRLLSVFDEIKEPGTDRVYNLLIRATEAFSWLEINGVQLDKEHLSELRIKYNQQLEEANGKVADAVAQLWDPMTYCKETGARYTKSLEDFNLKSPKQLKWMLRKATGVDVGSSDAATIDKLNEWIDQKVIHVSDVGKEFLTGITLSRKASKYLDTYVEGMEAAVRSDGRISGTYNLHGTETGRLSSSNPNMQNLPRLKEVKNLFKAPEGKVLMNLDYSQAELRVLGVVSGDEFLINSYKDGKDLHANVAQEIFGPNFTKEQRTMAKTVNFGIAYGRGASAISEAFKMSKADAQKIIDDWFKAMPKVKEYIQNQRRAADRGERQQTMFGRVRHYVRNEENAYHIQNEYINTPIQSMASDCTVTSLCEIHDWLVEQGYFILGQPECSRARIVITVHDSIVLEVDDDKDFIMEVAQKCTKIMHDVPEKLIANCPLPFKADAEYGPSYGKMEEIEL